MNENEIISATRKLLMNSAEDDAILERIIFGILCGTTLGQTEVVLQRVRSKISVHTQVGSLIRKK